MVVLLRGDGVSASEDEGARGVESSAVPEREVMMGGGGWAPGWPGRGATTMGTVGDGAGGSRVRGAIRAVGVEMGGVDGVGRARAALGCALVGLRTLPISYVRA